MSASATFLKIEHGGRIIILPFTGDYASFIESIRTIFEIESSLGIAISIDGAEVPSVSANVLNQFTGVLGVQIKAQRQTKPWPGGAGYRIPESILRSFPEVANPRLPSLMQSTGRCNAFLTAVFEDLLNYCDPAAPYLDKIGACYQDVSLAICNLPGLQISEEAYWRKKLIAKFHHAREKITKSGEAAPLVQHMRQRFNPSKNAANLPATVPPTSAASSSAAIVATSPIVLNESSNDAAHENVSERSSFIYSRSIDLTKHLASVVGIDEDYVAELEDENVDPVLQHLQSFEHRVASLQEATICSGIMQFPFLQQTKFVWREACLMSSLYAKAKSSDYVPVAELDISGFAQSLIVLSEKLPSVVKSYKEAKQFLPTINPDSDSVMVGLKLLCILMKVKPELLFDCTQLVYMNEEASTVFIVSEELVNYHADTIIDCITTFSAVFVAFNLCHLRTIEPVLEALEFILGLRKKAACSGFRNKIGQLKALLG